jgi:microcin C transport system substrate-binding protein
VVGSRNYAGIENSVVDALIEQLIAAPTRQSLIDYTRALDRVLLWNHYVIPQYHIRNFRLAYWDKFERPAVSPKYEVGLDTWWVNPQKSEQIEATRGTGN